MKKSIKQSTAKKQQPKQTAKQVKKDKPFVYYTTIWNSVGGGFSNPGEKRICNVGKHKVLVERAERLDRNGNPVHTATVIKKNGSFGESYRSNGSATLVVSEALKRNGVDTKRHTTPRKASGQKSTAKRK